MRLPCEIVQDLLPLYAENMCSAVSREAVEEHLRECPNCRELSAQVQGFAEPEMEVSGQMENQAVVKSFRKVRRRWFASLVAVLLVIPMVLLCVNQYRGEGICFTNLDDILAARRAAKALGREDFEEFAEYMDYEKLYQEIQGLLAQQPSPYDTRMVRAHIGDEEWIAYEEFYEQYLQGEGDPLETWAYLIYNNSIGIMIPVDIWDQVAAQNPSMFVTTEIPGEVMLEDMIYVPMKTQWGSYMVQKGSEILECVEAYEFCSHLAMIPQEIFEAAGPMQETRLLTQYEYYQETYGEVADMTLEEFTEVMKARYVADLQELADQGVSFDFRGLGFSYYIDEDGCWIIEYQMTVTIHGKIQPMSIGFAVQEGGLMIISTSYPGETRLDFDVAEALFMHYAR